MSDQDQSKLQDDLTKLLADHVVEINKELILGVQKAATSVYQQLLVNPWPDLLKENGGAYQFAEALADGIWAGLLKSKPSDIGKYSMDKLVSVWRQNYPVQWAEVVNKELAVELERTKELLAIERTVNSRNY